MRTHHAPSPNRLLGTLGIAAVLSLPLPAAARIWTLHDATFDDGTTLTGWFDVHWIGDPSDYWSLNWSTEAWDFQVQAAGSTPAFRYVPGSPNMSSVEPRESVGFFSVLTLEPFAYRHLRLLFTRGGPVDSIDRIDLDFNWMLNYEEDGAGHTRQLVSGYATAVPELPVAVLLLAGAATLGGLKRRGRGG